MNLNLSRSARRFLRGLASKQCKQVAMKVLDLASNPYPHDHIKMNDPEGRLRVDIGEFRIVYKVDGDVVFISVIGKRNDDEVYRHSGRTR